MYTIHLEYWVDPLVTGQCLLFQSKPNLKIWETSNCATLCTTSNPIISSRLFIPIQFISTYLLLTLQFIQINTTRITYRAVVDSK